MRSEFASFVVIARDEDATQLDALLGELEGSIRDHSLQAEVIIVRQNRSIADWASTAELVNGRSNLLVIDSVGSNGELDSAVQGLTQSIGEFVFLLEADRGQVGAIPEILVNLESGKKLVLGLPKGRRKGGFAYSIGRKIFAPMYRLIHRVDSATNFPLFRGMSREIVSLILASPQPELMLRYPGMATSNEMAQVSYTSAWSRPRKSSFWVAYASAMQLLLGGSRAPLRFASLLALFGATANVVYAVYVVAISLIREDLAEGWASTALQMSGMFFLVSLVLLLISEYLLQIVPASRYSRLTASPSFTVGTGQSGASNIQISLAKGSDQ